MVGDFLFGNVTNLSKPGRQGELVRQHMTTQPFV
jgi:hypothetical protein